MPSTVNDALVDQGTLLGNLDEIINLLLITPQYYILKYQNAGLTNLVIIPKTDQVHFNEWPILIGEMV